MLCGRGILITKSLWRWLSQGLKVEKESYTLEPVKNWIFRLVVQNYKDLWPNMLLKLFSHISLCAFEMRKMGITVDDVHTKHIKNINGDKGR